MASFGVVIGTFGDKSWADRAEIAAHSAMEAGADMIVTEHGSSLAQARNAGAAKLDTDIVTFLDADDRLDKSFFDNLDNYVDLNEKILYKPQTLGMYPDGSFDESACFIQTKDFFRTNCLVIGTSMRLVDFMTDGQFDDTLPVLEDWDMFLRLYIAGSRIVECEGVVYIVGVNEGRNSQVDLHRKTYRYVATKYARYRNLVKR
jgi:hypothetical protein